MFVLFPMLIAVLLIAECEHKCPHAQSYDSRINAQSEPKKREMYFDGREWKRTDVDKD